MKPADLAADLQQEALSRYYAGERVQAVIDAFGLDCTPNQFLRGFPPIVGGAPCPHCGSPMAARRMTRRPPYPAACRLEPAVCSGCGHSDTPFCDCAVCAPKRRQGTRQRPDRRRSGVAESDPVLRDAWERAQGSRPEPADLGVRLTLYLLAASSGLDPSGAVLRPLSELGQRVAPTPEYTARLVRALADAQLIAIEPAGVLPGSVADPLAFRSRHAERVPWRLALGRDARECRAYLAQLRAIAPARWSLDAHGEELADLWYESVREECAAHLDEYLVHFGLPGEAAAELHGTLGGLLAHLSGGELIASLWSAAKSAAAERHAGRGTRDPAAAVEARLRWLFDGFVEGRLIPFAYARSRRQPVSALAGLLSARFGLGADYLASVPSLPSLAAAWGRPPWGPPHARA